MFGRTKKKGPHTYFQIVESKREGKKVRQRVVLSLGRLDVLQATGKLDALVRALARQCERLMVLSEAASPTTSAEVRSIGPALVFDRLWSEIGCQEVVRAALKGRRYRFDVERAIFFTVLHHIMVSGSDRSAHAWSPDLAIEGAGSLGLHHLYRAMAWLGEELDDEAQGDRTHAPRCTKDRIEEALFERRRDLFAELDRVFFDTTSLYFTGEGGRTLGRHGHSKDRRPDHKQMVLGIVLDRKGTPVCSEMWPGNTAAVWSRTGA